MKLCKISFFIVFLCINCMTVIMAEDKPVIKVDFNEPSRKDEEVLETGYTGWKVTKDCLNHSLTINGITFTVTSEHNMRVGWNKAFVQAAVENSRLLGDGLNLDGQTDGFFTLAVTGLPEGTHTIQTYHNSWNDPASKTGFPIHIFYNGQEQTVLKRTYRQTSAANASIFTMSFDIKSKQDTAVFRFLTDFENDEADDPAITSYETSPILNGFELNTVNVTAKAKTPCPADGDMHIDADSGMYVVSWSPANNDVKCHHLYIGTDGKEVADATTASTGIYKGALPCSDTSYVMHDLYCLNTYYWRVDEEDRNGTVTPGTVWSFRPRHLAFRGAEGYGRFATGGRGGKVVYVTNLNSRGEGSFHQALTADIGPRTILFAVSGIITLDSRLTSPYDYITVAGQTAPGKGICFRSNSMGMSSESIWRFLRNRLGGGSSSYDGMGMRGNDHSIMDHCSISWTIDEGFSCREAYNLTLQHTMISECLNIAGHDKYAEGAEHGFSAVFGGDIGSFHHNVMAHARGRNPRMDGGMDGNGYYKGRLDIFNNVVYNWSSYGGNGESHEANFHNNYYKKGPASGSGNVILTADVNQRGSNKGTESYYYNGNALSDVNGRLIFTGNESHGGNGDNGGRWQLVNDMPITWTVWVDKPFYPSYANVESAQNAYKSTLSDVGCNLPLIDDHDKRIIREIQNGTYTYTGSVGGKKGVIDDESDCGGYEDYGNDFIDLDAFDTDRDGLPNWYEALAGTNPNSASGDFSDSNSDPDHDGFTLLEDYLDWMAVPHYTTSASKAIDIDLSPLTRGFNKQNTYSLEAAGHATVSFDGSTMTVTPETGFTGIDYIDFKVTDNEKHTLTRRIGLLVEKSDALEIITDEVLSTETFDLSGRRTGSSCDNLPSGVYILKETYRSGAVKCTKISR